MKWIKETLKEDLELNLNHVYWKESELIKDEFKSKDGLEGERGKGGRGG